jgi:ATP-dependent protease ClpP protease subunit
MQYRGQMGEQDSGRADEFQEVERTDNRIYFYCDVSAASAMELLKALRAADQEMTAAENRYGVRHRSLPIYLHVMSDGGEAFSGLMLADRLANYPRRLVGSIDGYAASAATLIALACHHRVMNSLGMILVHQGTTWIGGTHQQLADHKRMSDNMLEGLITFYLRAARGRLARESWLTASEAREMGFIDEIR